MLRRLQGPACPGQFPTESADCSIADDLSTVGTADAACMLH